MKKKFLLITFISALILSCSAFLIGLMPEKAMADEGGDAPAVDPPAATDITMVGAAIRTAFPYGLRFEAEIPTSEITDAEGNIREGMEFGMYLCPTDLLRTTGGKFPEDMNGHIMEPDATEATIDKYIMRADIPKDTLIPSTTEGKTLVRLALIEIQQRNFDREFTAMAYVKEGEGAEVRASDPVIRSVSSVAREAQNDPDSGLSESGDDRKFVDNIVKNSNDFYIDAEGVSVDTDVTRDGEFTHKITLGKDGTKDIDLSLDKRFEKDVICRIKLFAKADANAANIKINGKDVNTADFAEIILDDIQVVNNNVKLHITGDAEGNVLWINDIRAEGMRSLGTDGIRLSATGGAEGVSTLIPHPESNTVEYNAGGWQRDNVGFTPGKTIGSDEYLVIKFRYYEDMEETGTYYFTPNTYSNEGLWIQGLEGDTTHERHYFSTFDENFLDYTLYWRKDGDTSYEGNDTTIPYGSLHGTKGVTTEANTWYYAVAPVAGNYQKISSCNSYLHIDIADIYGVKGDIKEKLFKPQNYPKHLIAPGAMQIETRQTVNPEADVIASSLGMKAGDFGYAVADGSTLVTVDAEGNVTTGETAGECDITISAAGQEPVPLHITVIEGPKPFEGTGITRLSLDDLSVDHKDVSLKKLPYNRLEYSAPGYSYGEARIFIGGERRIADDEYLVIKFRCFNDMWFDKDTYGCEGLWPMGYDTAAEPQTAYFAIFDEDYLDYTIYKNEVGTPYGSYHGTKGLTTEPGTWYYAIAPKAGDWTAMSSCNHSAHIEIEGFYAVASDKIEPGDACLFKKGVYPKSVGVPAWIYLANVNDTYDLDVPANSFVTTAEELTYFSSDEAVATVSGGVITAVGAGTCRITVALQDNSISKEVVVDVEDGTNLSLARLYAIGEGTMTDTDEGYKSYDSNGKYWGNSEIGITDVPSDKYIVLKFKYIAQSAANDFYMYKGDGQDLPEYRVGAESTGYDFAFIFEYDEETNTYTDMTNYTNGVPKGIPKPMNGDNWYYWVSPNKGAYKGFTSDQPLKCVIGNVYAYTAEERQATFGIAVSGEDSGIVDLGLSCLSVAGDGPHYGEITDTEEGYKYYDSKGNKYDTSMIGIANAPSDRYIVLKFQYIAQDTANDFYMSYATGQDTPEYEPAEGRKTYDYAFIFKYNEVTGKYKDFTNYDANNVPWGYPKPMTDGDWYYWVSPNKGAYKGFTSDQPLKCNISNVYAYTAEARQAIFDNVESGEDSGIAELGLACLSVEGKSGEMGEITDTAEGYKCYDSLGNRYENSMIGIANAYSDRYIVFKFQYIEMQANTIFYSYKGEGQSWSEYRTGAESDRYDYAFLFEYDEETKTYTDMTKYTDGVPKGVPEKLTSGNWYYWVSANKGTYKGYSSDQILKCNISNVYAYTAEARQATFGIEVKG